MVDPAGVVRCFHCRGVKFCFCEPGGPFEDYFGDLEQTVGVPRLGSASRAGSVLLASDPRGQRQRYTNRPKGLRFR